jgi:predicted HicB family RNase H-like nuclease
MSPNGRAGENRYKRLPNYALRLQPSLMAEARKVAKSERVSLNQFFNVCVAEKLSARRAEESFQERFLRVAPAGILQILEQARKLKSSAGDS